MQMIGDVLSVTQNVCGIYEHYAGQSCATVILKISKTFINFVKLAVVMVSYMANTYKIPKHYLYHT